MTLGLQLGRPGIYRQDVRDPPPLRGVRLDVAGFVGVGLRGPVNQPTPVVSWADYERRFGGFEQNVSGRDRLLPYAVQAFFAQGGVRAWVVRVAAVDGPGVPTAEQATARFAIAGQEGCELVAADEGAWGSGLGIRLDFAVTSTFGGRFSEPDLIPLPVGVPLPNASLLRIRRTDVPKAELRLASVVTAPRTGQQLVVLDRMLPATDDGRPRVEAATVEVITGTLVVTDPAGSGERIASLGLDPAHPRYPPYVLADASGLVRSTGQAGESRLVRIGGTWDRPLRPGPLLAGLPYDLVRAGRDRSDAVDRDSFFDPGEPIDDPLDERLYLPGVDGLGRVSEVGIVCVPDLTWRTLPVPDPEPVVADAPRPRPRSHCDGCAEPEPVVLPEEPVPVVSPWLDGSDPTDLAMIIERQRRTVAVAELRRRFVVLLDVPVRLPTARVTDWRAEFDSSFAGAFHPWLGVPRGGQPGSAQQAVLVPPSAFAAGIMAERELRLGLPHGPANQLALGAVRAAEGIGEAEADRLHLQSINVFAAERDGFRLAAARTLSTDPDYRQLSVRRLMTLLALTVERHGQWLVFEPNTVALRSRLADSLTQLLRDLHRQGAFSGATEAESFFVRCDAGVNPPESQALGRLVAEIGVAPASPLEYLVLRIASDGDGGLVVDEAGRTGAVTEIREQEGASLV
jgi:Bacteriophage tail sheath protein